jgi:phosphotransferase system IIB component
MKTIDQIKNSLTCVDYMVSEHGSKIIGNRTKSFRPDAKNNTSLMVNEQINYFKNLVKNYCRDYLRIKIYTPEDMLNSTTFVDNMNVVFNDMKNVKLQIIDNSKLKLDKQLKEKVGLLMDKYNFIFDKSVGYDEKIQEYIKLKTGKEISLDRIRSMISGNSVK